MQSLRKIQRSFCIKHLIVSLSKNNSWAFYIAYLEFEMDLQCKTVVLSSRGVILHGLHPMALALMWTTVTADMEREKCEAISSNQWLDRSAWHLKQKILSCLTCLSVSVMSSEVHFYNPIMSAGKRACMDLSNIENRNFTQIHCTKINLVIRTFWDFKASCVKVQWDM